MTPLSPLLSYLFIDTDEQGDGVCDTTNGQKEITDEHTAYQGNTEMQNLGADFVIKAFNAVSTLVPSSAGSSGSGSTPATAIDAGTSHESVLAPTSIASVAYTVLYSSSIESTSSQSMIASLATPSSDSPSAPMSETPSASLSEVESIPTSVMAQAESSPAPSSSSSSVVEPASRRLISPSLPRASHPVLLVPGASESF